VYGLKPEDVLAGPEPRVYPPVPTIRHRGARESALPAGSWEDSAKNYEERVEQINRVVTEHKHATSQLDSVDDSNPAAELPASSAEQTHDEEAHSHPAITKALTGSASKRRFSSPCSNTDPETKSSLNDAINMSSDLDKPVRRTSIPATTSDSSHQVYNRKARHPNLRKKNKVRPAPRPKFEVLCVSRTRFNPTPSYGSLPPLAWIAVLRKSILWQEQAT
jgi:hypothetical protein